MSGVEIRKVASGEADMRLDRWFRLHFPDLGHGRLQKLLRTGQVRVDGRRAKAGARLEAGAEVRVPPLSDGPPPASPRPKNEPSDADAAFIRSLVLYRDDDVIALDKPPGLAVQGGTGTHRHIDAMLEALRFDAPEAPRLVHRLDRDTSGVLMLARSRAVAAALGKTFRGREVRKLYWAIAVGVPEPRLGRIDMAIAKLPGRAGEKMAVDEDEGQRATTYYRVMEAAARRLAWVALWPQTGRTHQLRVHAAALGWPILGDGKYGGPAAFIAGQGLSRKLHLHARALTLPHPATGAPLVVRAPLSGHMKETWKFFGFDPDDAGDPFAELP
ncbi:MAG: RluA family pseudouridine synthase [Alphaproteobacteria bacterium]|nr:RluA family pseudouridine synthase [Alphaproteobacteria bacterium]